MGNKKREGERLAQHRDAGSNPEQFESPRINLQLEDEHKDQENHNLSDIKLNLSADIKNFEQFSKFFYIISTRIYLKDIIEDINKFDYEENRETEGSNREIDKYNHENIFKAHKRMFSEAYKKLEEKDDPLENQSPAGKAQNNSQPQKYQDLTRPKKSSSSIN